MQELLKENVEVTIQAKSIYDSPCFKTLGFVVDQTLDWDDQY